MQEAPSAAHLQRRAAHYRERSSWKKVKWN